MRIKYEVRPMVDAPWVWQVWDVTHPGECNHFPVVTVDSKGAADDFHELYARVCAEALTNLRTPEPVAEPHPFDIYGHDWDGENPPPPHRTLTDDEAGLAALENLLTYHETGGHKGDGSDHAFRLARAELTALHRADATPTSEDAGLVEELEACSGWGKDVAGRREFMLVPGEVFARTFSVLRTNDEAVGLLERCRDREYNPFERDNQTKLYHDIVAFLTRQSAAPQGREQEI